MNLKGSMVQGIHRIDEANVLSEPSELDELSESSKFTEVSVPSEPESSEESRLLTWKFHVFKVPGQESFLEHIHPSESSLFWF